MTGRRFTTPRPARPEPSRRDLEALVGLDRVVAAYDADVDETILIDDLRLTPQERFDKFVRFMRFVAAVRGAARDAEPAADAAGSGVNRSPSPDSECSPGETLAEVFDPEGNVIGFFGPTL